MMMNSNTSNGNADEDDFLTLRLGQSSSSVGHSKSSAVLDLILPPPSSPQTPPTHHEQQLLPANIARFPFGFKEPAVVYVPQLQPLLSSHEPGAASGSRGPRSPMDPMPVQMDQQPLTPVQAPPRPPGPVQPSRVHSNLRNGKSEFVPPPFPWATSRRATVQSMGYLLANQISQIRGEVQCKTCNNKYWMEYDLKERFTEIATFIVNNLGKFHDRAPSVWTNSTLPTCRYCGQEGSARPVMASKKKAINWLFLLLGQLLGCCTLDHLKYFCKHTSNHRTGAKDRLLYLAYLELCKQLEPAGPFKNRG